MLRLGVQRRGEGSLSHLTAADDKDLLALDLPCQNKASPRLYLWEFPDHIGAEDPVGLSDDFRKRVDTYLLKFDDELRLRRRK